MKKLTYNDAQKLGMIFTQILKIKILQDYPDTFDKCKTLDQKEYDAANPCTYSWYMNICNSFFMFNFSPKYFQTEEEMLNSDWSYVKRFVDDFEKSKNWQAFLFEHMKIR